MNKKINWGIIGLGKIAHTFASDLQLSADSVLYGAASRSLDKANDFKQKHNAVKAFGTYEALLKDPEIDIIYIATPHALHFENAMACLQNGKHVLCEKPMGMHAEQVRLLMAKAEEQNCFLMEGLWTRFMPTTEKVLELLKNKVIGDIVLLEADFGFKPPFDSEKRIYNKSLGGGSLLDIGIYPVYLSLLSLGVPDKIQATASFSATGVDTFCGMMFDYAQGAKAVLRSTIQAITPTEAVIYGTMGSIKMHKPFHHCHNITLTVEGQVDEQFHLPKTGEGYIHEIREVEKCIRNKELQSSKHPLEFSLQLMETLDSIRKQIKLAYE